MGFERKVGGAGVSRWLLQLAGVLLAVAVTVTAGDAAQEGATAAQGILHGSRRICELKCQHWHDPVQKKRCVDFCIRYQLALQNINDGAIAAATVAAGEDTLRGSRQICELKCQHWHDPVQKKRCVDFCIRYQLAPKDISDGAIAVATVAAGEDTLRGSRQICELKCQHWHDPVQKKRCVDFCIRYQLVLHDMYDGAAAAAAAGAIRQVV